MPEGSRHEFLHGAHYGEQVNNFPADQRREGREDLPVMREECKQLRNTRYESVGISYQDYWAMEPEARASVEIPPPTEEEKTLAHEIHSLRSRELAGNLSDWMHDSGITATQLRDQLQILRESVKDAQVARREVQRIVQQYGREGIKNNPQVRAEYANYLTQQKRNRAEIGRLMEYGLGVEAVHREFIRQRLQYWDFKRNGKEQLTIRRQLDAGGQDLRARIATDTPGKDSAERSRQLAAAQRVAEGDSYPTNPTELSADDLLDLEEELKFIFPKGSAEFETATDILGDTAAANPEGLPLMTEAQLREHLAQLEEEAANYYKNPEVRQMAQIDAKQDMIDQLRRGEEVMELPSTVALLNRLHALEQVNRNRTIKAVLVGEPGTGKTTILRYYNGLKGRRTIAFDASGDITRYFLMGTREVGKKGNTLEAFNDVISELDDITDPEKGGGPDQLALFMLNLSEHDPEIAKHIEELAKQGLGAEEGNQPLMERISATLREVVDKKKMEELAKQYAHLGKTNGWRYGVMIEALRKDTTVIIDEFNKAKDWAPIFGLMTAIPASDAERGPNPGGDDKGQLNAEAFMALQKRATELGALMADAQGDETQLQGLFDQMNGLQEEVARSFKGWYYFADNNEWIPVPEGWGMDFTANIGGKHAVSGVLPALASRLEGSVIRMEPAPPKDEYLAMEVYLSDANRRMLRPSKDMEDLRHLIGDIIPKIRQSALAGEKTFLPISFRTLRNMSDRLVDRDNERARGTSVDTAIVQVMIESYGLMGEQSTTRRITDEIIGQCQTIGLLISEDAKRLLVSGKWQTEESFDAAKLAYEEAERARKEAAALAEAAIPMGDAARRVGADYGTADFDPVAKSF